MGKTHYSINTTKKTLEKKKAQASEKLFKKLKAAVLAHMQPIIRF